MAPRFPLIPVPGPPQPADKWDWIGDKFGTYAIQMSFVHNCIIRSINNMHTYAPFVQPNTPQAASFVAYILLVIQFIREHREGEEEVIIPFLQTKFDVQETVEAQSAFAKSIDAFEGHLKKVQNNEEGYDEKRVLDLVETFGDVLVDHLNHMVRSIPHHAYLHSDC